MLSLTVLLASGCGIIDRPDTVAAGDYTAYAGYETFKLGVSAGELNCDLHWDTVGTPALSTCPDCVFVFDVQFTFSDTQSTDDGTCGPQQVDFSGTYALVADASGYSVATWDGTSTAVFGSATFDPDSGEFTYRSQSDSYAYGYGYYDTRYTAGYASVQ